MDNGSYLCEHLYYNSQERQLRQLAVEKKLTTPEELAVMSKQEVCDLVAKTYAVVSTGDECVTLFPKDKMKLFNENVVYLER